ncbi:hypothetical protein VMCG_04013 [Cytospora schulzeri]|uniref:NACHT domain-containing protein n=1 Tax=Cytospora schulzeri TaxID=448051 RepID=A0A423WTC4_9PEZI|nr:hypothetical protein VMCG_04013 [Valsa malicola]
MPHDTSFKKALDKLLGSLTAEQRQEFGNTTLTDVKDQIQKIQDKYGSTKRLRNMARLSKFLEAMEQLEQVVSVFLNVNSSVAFVWGPIKFFLLVAATDLKTLECLLDTYIEISEVIPDLEEYTTLFKDHPRVLEVLERYYEDILQFHINALDVFGRRVGRRLFDNAWKTFRAKFKPILESLKRHRDLLAYTKSTAVFPELQSTRQILGDKIDALRTAFEADMKGVLSGFHERRKEIAAKLGAAGPGNTQGHHRMPEQRFPQSGDWILKDSVFLEWLDPMDPSSKTLYLNGMPGAGKTTLVSHVIDSLQSDATQYYGPLLCFYFEHRQDGKTLMADMLRAFIVQLLYQDDSILDYLQEQISTTNPSHLRDLAHLKELVLNAILVQSRCYIFIDGLDEGKEGTSEQIVQWLNTDLIPNSTKSGVPVKLLVSGQRDGILDQHLRCPSIRLDNTKSHLHDIEQYSLAMATQLKRKFGIDHEETIARKVTEASKGMFMYAKVVLEDLLSQTSLYELEEELQKEYPKDLDEAYERVSLRILDLAAPRRKEAALKILRWVAYEEG